MPLPCRYFKVPKRLLEAANAPEDEEYADDGYQGVSQQEVGQQEDDEVSAFDEVVESWLVRCPLRPAHARWARRHAGGVVMGTIHWSTHEQCASGATEPPPALHPFLSSPSAALALLIRTG
jgi:hypothetical protein